MTMITGERNIRMVQMLAWKHAIRLEAKGIRVRRGRLIKTQIAELFGLSARAKYDAVLEKLEAHMKDCDEGRADPINMKSK